MRHVSWLFAVALTGCNLVVGWEKDYTVDEGSGGTNGEGGVQGGQVNVGGVAGDAGAYNDTGGGGTAGVGGSAGVGGREFGGAAGDVHAGGLTTGGEGPEGGRGGHGGESWDCLSRTGRTETVLSGAVNGELDANHVYVLSGTVYVESGNTLTIPPCARFEGEPSGKLVVTRGARIEAEGEPDRPIVFTARTGTSAGSWGGILILGRAPNSIGDDANVPGMVTDSKNQYGGDTGNDNSGTLRYVRIEYPGHGDSSAKPDGLLLASVGSETVVDHVMVRDAADDCFTIAGGTISASHLICSGVADDMFDVAEGYVGTLHTLFGQHSGTTAVDVTGFEFDGTMDDAVAWDTEITVDKATLCGNGESHYGMVLARDVTGTLEHIVAQDFYTGVDLVDHADGISITNSIFDMSKIGSGDAGGDDDYGADDAAWFIDGEGNSTVNPGFSNADCLSLPPISTVFDSAVGAFADDANWAKGEWTGW